MSATPLTVYKILTGPEMAQLEADVFTGSAQDIADGYVHLSTAAQLADTVNRHFPDQSGLWLAAIDLAALGDAVRWEPARDGDLFPHVHGQLGLAAVIAYGPMERDPDGGIVLPTTG